MIKNNIISTIWLFSNTVLLITLALLIWNEKKERQYIISNECADVYYKSYSSYDTDRPIWIVETKEWSTVLESDVAEANLSNLSKGELIDLIVKYHMLFETLIGEEGNLINQDQTATGANLKEPMD